MNLQDQEKVDEKANENTHLEESSNTSQSSALSRKRDGEWDHITGKFWFVPKCSLFVGNSSEENVAKRTRSGAKKNG